MSTLKIPDEVWERAGKKWAAKYTSTTSDADSVRYAFKAVVGQLENIGWRMVPIKGTDKMYAEFYGKWEEKTPEEIWQDAIAAAPKVEI